MIVMTPPRSVPELGAELLAGDLAAAKATIVSLESDVVTYREIALEALNLLHDLTCKYRKLKRLYRRQWKAA